jgi:ribosomal protein S18 acetylase RimI-like enzyme
MNLTLRPMTDNQFDSRRRGVVSVRLNVFGHNAPARELYDSVGFAVVSTSMKLTL